MATRIRWLGHSALLVESDGTNILIDPFLSDNPAAAAKAAEVPADFVLVTHGHGDHVGDAVAIAKRTDATVVCNFEIGQWMARQGVGKVHDMHLGGRFAFPFGDVKMTVALHGSMLPDGSNGGNPGGFHLFLRDGSTIYHAGDTALFGDMKLIGEEGIDLAALPIGDNYTMGPADSWRAISLLTPSMVLPIHFNTYPIIAQDANAWAQQVSRFHPNTEPVLIEPGGWVTLR